MKKRIFCVTALILLCLTQSSSAQDNASIKTLCAQLEKKYSLKLHIAKLPPLSWKIDYQLAGNSDRRKLYRYILLFDNEFSKYPKSFLEKTKISAAVFVKSLAYKKQLRTAIPDYDKEILILDFVRGDHNPTYQQHVIHHEFYHMIEEEFNEDAYWKDPNWAKLNEPGVQYGSGGKTAQNTPGVYSFTHPEKGFLNLYSKSAIEEDKAEIFAALFVKAEFEKLVRWTRRDKVLYAKTKYMASSLRKHDQKFTKQYWLKLHQRK